MIPTENARGEIMTPWFFISDGRYPSGMNMQRDEAIFVKVIKREIPGALRFYNWDRAAVTTGYHQKGFRLYDEDLDIPVLMRPTGGGAVLHSNDITFSVSAPSEGPFKGDIMAAYVLISNVLLKAFKATGLEAELLIIKSGFSDVCFERAAQLELSYMGRKIMGAAQMRKREFFLLQGVIPLNVDRVLYERVFGPKAKPPVGICEMMPQFPVQSFIQTTRKLMDESLITGDT
jgi:lipoyl(octanoyl) transferase